MSIGRNVLAAAFVTAATSITLSNIVHAQAVPTDPAAGNCQISPGGVASMFESGTVTLNGVVKPANSTVALAPNCGFFSWTEQMFLWLTSPAPSRYGGGSRIMFSPAFFTVSPEDSTGRRTFIRNQANGILRMGLRMTELGPHNLPALVSRSGQVIEVQKPDPKRPVPAVVRLQDGRSVRLGDVRVAPGNRLQFFDTTGKQVQVKRLAPPPTPRIMVRMTDGTRVPIISRAQLLKPIQARKLVFRGIPIFIDPANNVIDVEPGQADGGVLLSQNGSLIFYISVVNDVYAYHRTMQPNVIPSPTNITFPLTAADGNAVVAFAASHGFTIVDPEALAIEAKSSWVEASSVANPDEYVQATATIPTFDKSNPQEWVPNGQKTVKMVLVGIHVVGSTFGHGEMVWGTFEHLGNTPNASYSYNSTTGPKSVPQTTSGTWLFTPNGSAGPFNQMNASWNTSNGHLVTTSVGTPIQPTPILRMMPWGTNGTNSSLNTQVIGSNASVISQLLGGDVRRNYFQLGTTWTIGGAAPNGANEVGTNLLANSTLETFAQGTNCFACHQTNKVTVSHLYREAKPLF